jgi:hypothetical protein
MGVGFQQNVTFSFLRDDLVDANLLPEIGDIILYQEGYYGVESTITNQLFLGKNPEYSDDEPTYASHSSLPF